MSNNIWGYQGLQTPLENLTRGNYNVADYTNMRKEFNSRILALENAGGFQPNSVTMTGFLKIIPSSGGNGYLTIQGPATFGSTLSVASTSNFLAPVTVNGGLSVTAGVTCNDAIVNTSLTVGGLLTVGTVAVDNVVISGDIDVPTATVGSLNVQDVTASGNITASSPGKFIGDGSSLTGVLGTDVTKLPLTGGTLSGAVSSNSTITSSANISTTGVGKFVGDGSSLTGVLGTDVTKLPLTGGTLSGALTVSSGALTVSSGNITATSGQFVGNGAGLTGITSTDPTKLPLSGGIMTGSITSQSISVLPGYTIYNNKGNKFSFFQNSFAGPFIVNQQNGSVHDYIKLLGNSSCTVSLVNLVTTDNQNYQDQQRLATITKRNMVNGDYSVSVVPPLNYIFNSKVAINASSYTIPLGVFSVTFMINSVSSQLAYEIDVISTVTV